MKHLTRNNFYVIDLNESKKNAWFVKKVEVNDNFKIVSVSSYKISLIPEYLGGTIVGFIYLGSKENALKRIEDLDIYKQISQI